MGCYARRHDVTSKVSASNLASYGSCDIDNCSSDLRSARDLGPASNLARNTQASANQVRRLTNSIAQIGREEVIAAGTKEAMASVAHRTDLILSLVR